MTGKGEIRDPQVTLVETELVENLAEELANGAWKRFAPDVVVRARRFTGQHQAGGRLSEAKPAW